MMKSHLIKALLVGLATMSGTAWAADPAILAHRGGALVWPENSLYAFKQAQQMGAEYLEMDLQLTEDNELLVTHDADINPQFCKPEPDVGLVAKPVRALTLARSQQFECGLASRSIYPDAEKVKDIRMPSLDAVFESFSGDKQLRYFIETKMPKAGAPGAPIDTTLYAAKLDQLIRKHGLEDRVILQSFDWRTIEAMRLLNPAVRTCPLAVPRHSSDYLATLKRLGSTCIVLSAQETTAEQVRDLQAQGVLVFSGVVDRPADWEQALQRGYDAIFTNDPVGLDAILRTQGRRGH